MSFVETGQMSSVETGQMTLYINRAYKPNRKKGGCWMGSAEATVKLGNAVKLEDWGGKNLTIAWTMIFEPLFGRKSGAI